MTARRYAILAAVLGGVLFLACSLVVKGGPLDSAQYGDVTYYGHYAHLMREGQWPYRNFFDEYPPLAQPLFLGVELLPGPFFSEFKWMMVVCGIGALALLVATLATLDVSRPRIAVAALTAGVAPHRRRPDLPHGVRPLPRTARLRCVARLRSPTRASGVRAARARGRREGLPCRAAADRADRVVGARRARARAPRPHLVRRRPVRRASALRHRRAGRSPLQLLGADQARPGGGEPRRGRAARARPAGPAARRPAQRGARVEGRDRHAREGDRGAVLARARRRCAARRVAVPQAAALAAPCRRRRRHRVRRLQQGLLAAVRRLARPARPGRGLRRLGAPARGAAADRSGVPALHHRSGRGRDGCARSHGGSSRATSSSSRSSACSPAALALRSREGSRSRSGR